MHLRVRLRVEELGGGGGAGAVAAELVEGEAEGEALEEGEAARGVEAAPGLGADDGVGGGAGDAVGGGDEQRGAVRLGGAGQPQPGGLGAAAAGDRRQAEVEDDKRQPTGEDRLGSGQRLAEVARAHPQQAVGVGAGSRQALGIEMVTEVDERRRFAGRGGGGERRQRRPEAAARRPADQLDQAAARQPGRRTAGGEQPVERRQTGGEGARPLLLTAPPELAAGDHLAGQVGRRLGA